MKKNNIVTQAIESTKAMGTEGQEWLDGIYRKISFEGGTGSCLLMAPKAVRKLIEGADWEIEEIVEDDRPKAYLVAHGTHGFYRMRSLDELADDEKLLVAKFHGDKPQLGWVSDVYDGILTDEIHAVCGIDQEKNGTFLITVIVGKLIDAKAVEAPEERLGETITVAEAKRFGASYCKVVTTAAAKAAKEALAE